MTKVSLSWLDLKPNQDNFGNQEDYSDYIKRIRKTFSEFDHIPDDVIEQWLWAHHSNYETLRNYAWINYKDAEFFLSQWTNEQLTDINVIEEYSDYVKNRARYTDIHDFCCLEEDLNNWINNGTWRTPPIIIDVSTIKEKIPTWSEIKPPYQLIEGHSRLGYLCSMINLEKHGKVKELKLNTMKKHLIFLAISFLTFQIGLSQTPVSGGVFSNTTWTQANSPYIVTGNVVVFPGVILTIQPGVTVKFYDGTNMEIRQSTLVANGTLSNPIIFTSNNSTPIIGSWNQIYVNQSVNIQIKYCEFHYANNALTGQCNSLSVVSSIFTDNIVGMDAQSNIYNRIDSCIFKNNNTGQIIPQGIENVTNSSYINNSTGLYAQTRCNIVNCIIDSNDVYGLLKHMACNDTIRNNEIKFNGTGIAHDYSGCGGTIWIYDNEIENNSVGILLQNMGGVQIFNIYNNIICSNSTYNFQNLTALSVNAANNCWCSNNATHIASTIYDAYDNVNYGIVTFNPIDTVICNITTGYESHHTNTLTDYYIYPNPIKNEAILKFKNSKKENCTLTIYDSYGRSVRKIYHISTDVIEIERQELESGIFLFQIHSENRIVTIGKFIIE